jgi:c-di-GMP-binding flagellar brake protein YcgR
LDKLVAELTCADGTLIQGEVFDVSNRGLSVLIATAQGAVVPGEMISAINVKRADESVVLSGQRAVVRHIRLFDGSDDGACYKVGLELRPPAAREPAGDEQVVTDPTRIAALLQEGLEGRDLVVRAMDRAASVPARFERLDSIQRELILTSDLLAPLEIGDVVRASFEYRGGSYSFYASLCDSSQSESTAAYSLKLPRAISFVTQRRSVRIKPSPHSVVHLNFRLPFDGRTLQKEVVNITSSGLAFVANESTELLPVGTMLSDASVVFASGGSQQVSCIVRSLSRRGSSGESLCGVEFCGLTAAERIRLVDAVANSDMPELREADPTSFDEIWKFFLDTGFLYPEKLSSIDLATVDQTMRRLLGAPPDMYKATLFGQPNRIDAHVCGLKVYSGTWILQHLAARPGGKQLMTRGRALSLAIIRHMEQLPDNEWIKIWYRPANRWPSRVYGSFARRIADPALSMLKVHNYMVGKIGGETDPPTLTVDAANEQDLAELEAYIVARGELLLLRSDDYSRSQILLPEISARFREIGLQRCREVLVARRNGRSVGFALLEISSRGLNLSELTNTFRLVCDPRESDVQQALIWHARERYRALGYTRCVGLADDEHLGAFQTMGFEAVKRYACWTWHRSLHEAFCEHLRELRI